MAMISKAAQGRYSSSQGLPGPELPREGRRAGGKIEIVHGQEIDPFFADGLDLPSRGRTPGPPYLRPRLSPCIHNTPYFLDAC